MRSRVKPGTRRKHDNIASFFINSKMPQYDIFHHGKKQRLFLTFSVTWTVVGTLRGAGSLNQLNPDFP